MFAYIRGVRSSGEPIEAESELPDDMAVGDSFLYGPEHDRERVQIVELRKGLLPDGVEFVTARVQPLPAHLQ